MKCKDCPYYDEELLGTPKHPYCEYHGIPCKEAEGCDGVPSDIDELFGK